MTKTKSAGILLLIVSLCFTSLAQSAEKESVYDRVMRTGTIRVAYGINPPSLMKDPNTGKLTGIYYDIVNKLCSDLQLKADWVEEVGWGQMNTEVETGRADIIAGGIWVSPGRARTADYTIMLYYSPMGIWVRPDDHRFDDDFSKINDPNVTVAVLEGEMSSIIAQNVFPKAKAVTLPQLSDISLNLLNVMTKKGDVTFVEPALAVDFLKHNPNALRNIAARKPFRVFGNSFLVKRGEVEFKNLINLILEQMLEFGYVDEVLKKYEPFPNAFYRVAPPYVLK